MKRLLILAFALTSCGDDRVAGKTTTTGNGLIPVDETGTVIVGARARASSGWDALSASPTDTVELRQSSDGTIHLDGRPWAFVEVRSPDGSRIALVRRPTTEGTARLVLQDPDALDLRWIDHARHPGARAVVESSFVSGPVGSSGMIALSGAFVPRARLVLETSTGTILPAGTMIDGRLVESSLNWLRGASPLPLWIDDFESTGGGSRLSASWPGTSGWRSFLRNAVGIDPPGAGSLATAVVPSGPGGSLALSFTFRIDSTNGWAAAQLSVPAMDLRSRGRFCLEYRSQGRLKVEFLRSTTPGASAFAATLPTAGAWKDTCLAVGAFAPASGNAPVDSAWEAFADSVGVLQLLALQGANRLDLDNLRFDPTVP